MMLGEAGTEQFTITTYQDGKQIRLQKIHDPFIRCTVGIAPLVDRPFNRSKSWIKGLEYSAFGLPFVASPLPGSAQAE